MSKYDNLDPRTELEQEITSDLKRALEKRGFTVIHNGSESMNAPANKSDIVVFNESTYINIEVTKRTKSTSDSEFLSIKDHFTRTKRENNTKKCFLFYVSPETHYRMINAIQDYNVMNHKKEDMKMIPVSFSTFELFIQKLIESHKDEYPSSQIMKVFDDHRDFVDDERVIKVFFNKLFNDDRELKKKIDIKEEQKHQTTVEMIINELLKLEDNLREELGITHIDAVRNIIFLVFIKLYEEKREYEGKKNRFKLESFLDFQQDVSQEDGKKATEILFNQIKEDRELKVAKVFTEHDILAEKLNDSFVIDFFIKPFERYHFYTTKIDGLGAAYEVLGMRAGKDVKAGQFFTPENVVRFMVKLAELDVDDLILDPACGTGRFLIYSMEDLLSKVGSRNKADKINNIKRKQLFGSDYDARVAKLAKMNMYIHGDGKSNIRDSDGLLMFDFDDKVDVVLTNPPLGEQSYLKGDDDFKLKRMEVIPKKAKKLKNGDIEYKVAGSKMKGGALFINASLCYLKSVRDRDALPEWRGGKLILIIDEGVLNTHNYSEVRDFIRRNFYIKAVASLTKDTFVPVSKTSTKTSILYLIKKDDKEAIQQEPIFFAHIDKVGVNTRRKVCENHLFNEGNDILTRYFDFKKKVLNSYVGLKFDKQRFSETGFNGGVIK